MILQAFSVYDSKAKAFSPPFFQANNALAIRAFTELANDEGRNNVSRFPEDFSLHHIGEFDDSTGKLSELPPTNLGLASQFTAAAPKKVRKTKE